MRAGDGPASVSPRRPLIYREKLWLNMHKAGWALHYRCFLLVSFISRFFVLLQCTHWTEKWTGAHDQGCYTPLENDLQLGPSDAWVSETGCNPQYPKIHHGTPHISRQERGRRAQGKPQSSILDLNIPIWSTDINIENSRSTRATISDTQPSLAFCVICPFSPVFERQRTQSNKQDSTWSGISTL